MLYRELNRSSRDYVRHLPTWRHINTFREGYDAIMAHAGDYLPARPDEPAEVYEHRISKPSYTPVMSEAIRDLAARLRKSPYRVTGLTEDDRWGRWEDSTDGREQDISLLIYRAFVELLYQGRCSIGILNPPGPQAVSALDSQAILPRAVFFDPWEVILAGPDGYVTKQHIYQELPLQPAKLFVRFTVWLPDRTEVYQAEARVREGQPISLWNEDHWVGLNAADVPMLGQPYYHDLGEPLLVHRELSPELWIGGRVWPKQWQHLLIENAWVDAGSYAGTVQRVYTPPDPQPVPDARVVYEQPDYSGLKSDNAHILVGKGFAFVESEGSALANLESQLSLIAQQIKSLVAMTFASGSDIRTQSGVAKEVDQSLLNDSLGTYGEVMKDLLEGIYMRVAIQLGASRDTVGEITVTGFNHYRTDTLETLLEKTANILTVSDRLSPLALRLWLMELTRAMLPNLSPEDLNIIERETDAQAQAAPDPDQDE